MFAFQNEQISIATESILLASSISPHYKQHIANGYSEPCQINKRESLAFRL